MRRFNTGLTEGQAISLYQIPQMIKDRISSGIDVDPDIEKKLKKEFGSKWRDIVGQNPNFSINRVVTDPSTGCPTATGYTNENPGYTALMLSWTKDF